MKKIEINVTTPESEDESGKRKLGLGIANEDLEGFDSVGDESESSRWRKKFNPSSNLLVHYHYIIILKHI